MPDNLSNSEALKAEQERADLAKTRGRIAATIKDPEAKRRYISKQGDAETTSLKMTGKPGASTRDLEYETSKSADPSSFRRGGRVRRTGMAKVHRGERVLTKTQNRRYMKGKS